MTETKDKIAAKKQRLETLILELHELTDSLPAHSVKPSQLLRMEALEDQIEQLKHELQALKNTPE
nr:hypothetical protein [Anaerolineae bacterium]